LKTVLKATDVRRNWSKFIDDVKWVKPAFIKRNRDIIAVLPFDLLEFILKEYKLTVKVVQEEDGSYTGIINEMDLMANAPDIESLKIELAKELKEYSEEYIDEFRLYYNSTNRKNHFPYVYRTILVSDDIGKVKELFSLSFKLKKKAS
jgi:sporulation protein YlmC with PRC-barrel domain